MGTAARDSTTRQTPDGHRGTRQNHPADTRWVVQTEEDTVKARMDGRALRWLA